MKSSQLVAGAKATTLINRVRSLVTVVGLSNSGTEYIVLSARSGQLIYRRARQLKAVSTVTAALAVTSSSPGQTIDAGNVVITTTLHRLG